MVAMRRQLSLIKEDWPYSLIAHILGMSLLSIFGHKTFLLTTDFLMPLHSWFSKVNFILLKYPMLWCRWKTLKRQLVNMRAHSDAKGIELRRANESVYTFPCPDCMCRPNKSEHSKSIQAR
jgi:hypothetical protein